LYDIGIDKESVMTRVTISPKFQVVIPKMIREHLDLRPGQQVQAIEYDGRIEFLPVRPISSMRGFLSGIDSTVERDEDRL
jgi:AbrB family looped-hinge helix DNA binding protein